LLDLPAHIGGSEVLVLPNALALTPWLRSGIALYGDYAPLRDLEPVMSFKSRVIYRRLAPAGTAISYGGTFVTTRPTELALIGAGYGNGYPRSLSSQGHVLARGRRCPILGRVCMDQIVVDVSETPEVRVGEEAVLFGRQGKAELRIDEVARQAGTISYDLLCLAGQLNPRLYV
jgi:alanine racemase